MELLPCQPAAPLLVPQPQGPWDMLLSQGSLAFDLLECNVFPDSCEQQTSSGSDPTVLTNPILSTSISDHAHQPNITEERDVVKSSKKSARIRSSASKPQTKRKRRSSTSIGTYEGPSAAAGPQTDSRWFKTRNKLEILQQEALQKSSQAAELQAQNVALQARSTVLEYSVQCRDFTMALISRYHKLCGLDASLPDDEEARELRQYATMSLSDVASSVRRFVTQASTLLLQLTDAQATGQEEHKECALSSITQLVMLQNHIMSHVMTLNPLSNSAALFYSLDARPSDLEAVLSCREEASAFPGLAPPPDHWVHVAWQVQPTQQQLQQFAAVWAQHCRLQSKLDAEHRMLSDRLKAAMSEGNMCRQMELCNRLEGLGRRAIATAKLACFLVMGKILEPLQKARLVVQSFPFLPQALQVIPAVLQLHDMMPMQA